MPKFLYFQSLVTMKVFQSIGQSDIQSIMSNDTTILLLFTCLSLPFNWSWHKVTFMATHIQWLATSHTQEWKNILKNFSSLTSCCEHDHQLFLSLNFFPFQFLSIFLNFPLFLLFRFSLSSFFFLSFSYSDFLSPHSSSSLSPIPIFSLLILLLLNLPVIDPILYLLVSHLLRSRVIFPFHGYTMRLLSNGVIGYLMMPSRHWDSKRLDT